MSQEKPFIKVVVALNSELAQKGLFITDQELLDFFFRMHYPFQSLLFSDPEELITVVDNLLRMNLSIKYVDDQGNEFVTIEAALARITSK